ncbi:MAG TPA: TPM domain-containing protein [Thermomicrobiales bacterium]|nr:TPM domain-containing protein [Thermomicrobiales bacterium]
MAQSDPDFEPTWYMVVDWANLLDERQETSAINDTWRLNLLGVPTQVVTELIESTPELARQRAEALRVEHGIESAPSADDGMLIYAAVNPSNRSLVTVAVAAGPNGLPTGGLTTGDLSDIQSNIVVPQLTAGHPARAIVYSVREMTYQQIFTPPPTFRQGGLRASLNDIMPWLAPLIAIPLAIVALRNVQDLRGFPIALKRAALPLVGALVLTVVAIEVQSTPGIFWAIGLILVSVAVLILADRKPQPSGRRVLITTPRPPGRFTSNVEAGS